MEEVGTSSVSTLVTAALQGDQRAWTELVARYTPLVASVVWRHHLRPGEGEDVIQTVWLRLVEHLDTLREPRALPGWILTTARNECVRALRIRGETVPSDILEQVMIADDDTEDEVGAAMTDVDRHQVLLAALAELPRRQRELLILLIQDPPVAYDEISRRLDMPVGSIGPTRARALARIRQHPGVSALMTW